jgi:hypothetical protein
MTNSCPACGVSESESVAVTSSRRKHANAVYLATLLMLSLRANKLNMRVCVCVTFCKKYIFSKLQEFLNTLEKEERRIGFPLCLCRFHLQGTCSTVYPVE